MAQKSFLSWVGFKGDSAPATTVDEESPKVGGLERIRELESQLADLRSRKDITSLTKEEFEILATETAMSLVKTAQIREKNATSQAAKVLAESSRIAQEAIAASESKSKSILSAAESRGRKYLEVAESEGSEIKNQAERTARALAESVKREVAALRSKTEEEIQSLTDAKKQEAVAITANAKHEAERLVKEAVGSIADYRNWLVSAVAESERLHKVQTQSLAAAQQAIEQSRQRLAHAFEKLSSLTNDVNESLDENNIPLAKELIRSKENFSRGNEPTSAKKSAVKQNTLTKGSATKKIAKKATSKKASARKSAVKKSARK